MNKGKRKPDETMEIVRARHHTWPNDFSDDNIFAGCVTADPSEIDGAWAQLAKSTWELEIATLPVLMHHALLATLKKRTRETSEYVSE